MADIFHISNYIVNYPQICVDNLKLQKLLFYSQAVALFVNGQPLFDDDIRAWDYGPVIPAVYRRYRKFDGRITENPRKIELSSDELNAVDLALQNYGDKSGAELIRLTHSEKPWRDAYAKGRNSVISHQAIKEYYSTVYRYE